MRRLGLSTETETAKTGDVVHFVVDEEGDIGVTFFNGVLTIIKYKEHSIWYFFKKHEDAPRLFRGGY